MQLHPQTSWSKNIWVQLKYYSTAPYSDETENVYIVDFRMYAKSFTHPKMGGVNILHNNTWSCEAWFFISGFVTVCELTHSHNQWPHGECDCPTWDCHWVVFTWTVCCGVQLPMTADVTFGWICFQCWYWQYPVSLSFWFLLLPFCLFLWRQKQKL